MHTTATTIIRSMELLRSPGSISPVTRSPVTRNMTPGRVRAATPAASVRRQAGSPVGAGQRQQPYAGGYPQQGAYQRTPYQPYGQPPKKNNTGKIIAIVVSIVVALALIGVLVWALTSKGGDGKDGKGTETSQTTNGGSNNKNKDGYIEVPRGDSNGNSDDDSYDSINKDYQQKKQELDKKKQELQQELDNYKKKYGGSSSYDNQNSYDSYGDSYDSYGDSYDSTGY